MTTDGSMAVWAAHKPDCAGAEMEVHFNYWRIAADPSFKPTDNNAKRDFVEIGVLLRNAANVSQIRLFIPGVAWLLEDCGPRFAKPEIAEGIFNIHLKATVSAPPGPTYVDLLNLDDEHFCRVHKFRTNQSHIDQGQLATSQISGGTLLTITPAALEEICAGINNTPAYFRLRAYWNGEGTSPFVEEISPSDKMFQSGYNKLQYLDFRLNEARTLPTEVETLMHDDARRAVPQTMAAFLTAVPVQLNVMASSVEEHKMRLLEFNLWKDYVPGEIPRGMVVYHWKAAAQKIQDFSAFVKMESRVSSRRVLLAYLAIGFLFATSASLAASLIYDQTNGLGLKQEFRSTPVEKTNLNRATSDFPVNSANPPPLPSQERQK